jgi:hypothetical protein
MKRGACWSIETAPQRLMSSRPSSWVCSPRTIHSMRTFLLIGLCAAYTISIRTKAQKIVLSGSSASSLIQMPNCTTRARTFSKPVMLRGLRR